MKTVSLVGSTGSIGTQAVDVIRAQPGEYRVVALGASSSVDRLVAQTVELRPEQVAIADPSLAEKVKAGVPAGTEVLAGPEALAEIACHADVVVNGVVGFAGLPVTMAALRAGRRLALANKESLIAGGPVVQRVRSTPGAEIIPVDSEHCAVHQCLRAIATDRLRRIVLTASGGPFRGRSRDELADVTIGDALAHPTWSMGPKITIDSSTLMNKGLEVIEAHELFGTPYDRIEVVVHPQSIIHSMVETTDGATLAQLSLPDMRLPIGYALAYPDRSTVAFGAIDWAVLSRLDFEAPDFEAFPCLGLAYHAGRTGGNAPAALNGANEVAVDAFLKGRIQWADISKVIEITLSDFPFTDPEGVDEVIETDREARMRARRIVEQRVAVRMSRDTYDAGPAPLDAGLVPNAAPATASRPPAIDEPGRPGVDPENPRAALARLALIVAAIIVVATVAGVGKTVAIVAALILMIMLHEFGHFITAKWADMKVTEYFLGFGPRLWSIRKGETEYGVKALPFGGYVKITGMTNIEEVDPADEPRAYRRKPYLRRLSVALAGSTMHFLIALVLLFALFFVTGRPGNPSNQVGSLYRLSSGPSPAQTAGFRVGDRIVAVDGRKFSSLDLQGNYIRSKPDQRIDVTVVRDGRTIDLFPTPVDLSKVTVEGAPVGPAPSQPEGFIGIGYYVPTLHYGFFSSINRAGGLFVDISARTFDALGSLLSAHGVSSYGHMLTNSKAANAPNAVRFSSPVGIVRVANQAAKTGISDVLTLLILINIFVGIFNLLPLLPLDGGHVAIATYEAVRSRKQRSYHADVTKLMPLTYAVFLILVFIGGSALFLDVRDLISTVRF